MLSKKSNFNTIYYLDSESGGIYCELWPSREKVLHPKYVNMLNYLKSKTPITKTHLRTVIARKEQILLDWLINAMDQSSIKPGRFEYLANIATTTWPDDKDTRCRCIRFIYDNYHVLPTRIIDFYACNLILDKVSNWHDILYLNNQMIQRKKEQYRTILNTCIAMSQLLLVSSNSNTGLPPYVLLEIIEWAVPDITDAFNVVIPPLMALHKRDLDKGYLKHYEKITLIVNIYSSIRGLLRSRSC